MICKADFEDLFPEMFRPRDNETSAAEPSAECVTRWEDDGGRGAPVAPTRQPDASCSRRPCLAHPAVFTVTMGFIAYGVLCGIFTAHLSRDWSVAP